MAALNTASQDRITSAFLGLTSIHHNFRYDFGHSAFATPNQGEFLEHCVHLILVSDIRLLRYSITICIMVLKVYIKRLLWGKGGR